MRRRGRDWLYVLKRTLDVAVVLGVIGGLAAAVAAFASRSLAVQVPARAIAAVNGAPSGPSGVRVDPNELVGILVSNPSAATRALGVMTWLPTLVAAVIVLQGLSRIVTTALHDHPFRGDAVKSWRHLAVITAVGGVVAVALQEICRGFLVSQVSDHSPVFTPASPLGWLLLAVGFLAAGQVIDRGARLDEELREVV